MIVLLVIVAVDLVTYNLFSLGLIFFQLGTQDQPIFCMLPQCFQLFATLHKFHLSDFNDVEFFSDDWVVHEALKLGVALWRLQTRQQLIALINQLLQVDFPDFTIA